MKHLLGKLVCMIVRAFGGSHAWRRLRKSEDRWDQPERICDRCGFRRTVKPRKEKPSAQLAAGLQRLADK